MPHILVAGNIHPAGLERLRAEPGFTVTLVPEVSVASYVPHLAQADALLIRTQPLTAADIAAAPRLQVVSRHGVGYDSVDVAALSERHIPLTVVGDVNSQSVAEHTLSLLLALAKRTTWFDRSIRAGEWDCRNGFSAVELAGRTLLLLGFGRIGREVARLAGSFRMRVLAYDPWLSEAAFVEQQVGRVTDLHQGLPLADAVSLHLPLSGDKPLIGREELALMKPGALLINTARGGLIDENALAGALHANRLGGAGLDVLQDEPACLQSSLLSQSDRLILSPHAAGLTAEAAMRMSVAAADNIIRHFRGQHDSRLVVNPQVLPLQALMNQLP